MTDLTGIRSSSVTVNGLRMHVTDAGAGTPVLLLHGFPESSREWAPVMTALSDRARLVAPDLRGAGETDAPNAGYDSETVQRDLIALLDGVRGRLTIGGVLQGLLDFPCELLDHRDVFEVLLVIRNQALGLFVRRVWPFLALHGRSTGNEDFLSQRREALS